MNPALPHSYRLPPFPSCLLPLLPIFQSMSQDHLFHRTYHDTPYTLHLTSHPDRIQITAEETGSNQVWKGDFSARFIEDLTGKTGNAKKFSVFEKMLLKGLEGGSGSVVADLLSAQELEHLRAKRPGKQPLLTARLGNNKRYLILTYTVEFDKVHYPLPLVYEEPEDAGYLKETVRRLKEEIRSMKSGGGREGEEGHRRMEEKVKELEEENHRIRLENEELQDQLRAEKVQSTSTIRQLREVNVRLQRELDRIREEMDQLIVQVEEEQSLRDQLPDVKTLMTMAQEYAQLKRTVKEQKEALERIRIDPYFLYSPKRSLSAPKQPKTALLTPSIPAKTSPDTSTLESSVAKLDRILQLIKT